MFYEFAFITCKKVTIGNDVILRYKKISETNNNGYDKNIYRTKMDYLKKCYCIRFRLLFLKKVSNTFISYYVAAISKT